MKKTIQLLGILVSIGLLGACHQSPLKTHTTRKSTQFLVKASMAAAKSLRLNLWERTAQNLYLSCLDGDLSKVVDIKGHPVTVDCGLVYKAMVDFAKSYELPDFKNVRLADLTDEKAIEPLREGYEERVAFDNAWEG